MLYFGYVRSKSENVAIMWNAHCSISIYIL